MRVKVILFLSVLLCFTSCDSFLNGGAYKEELDAFISYINTTPTEIRVDIEEGSGSLITLPILSKKVSDTFDIEFKIAEGYQFKVWKIYKYSVDGSFSELGTEYMYFIKDSQNGLNQNGVYKASIKYEKEVPLAEGEKIIIKPLCSKIPAVISYSPSLTSQSQFANVPVIITFNMPLENINFDFTNVSLTYYGSPVSEFFRSPQLNKEKTVLTIYPDSKALSDFIKEQNRPSIDILVSLNEDTLYDKNKTFTVRYSSQMEINPPQEVDFFVTREALTFGQTNGYKSDEIEDNEKLFVGNYDLLNETGYVLQNRIVDTVYIYGKYFDDESGVKQVVVTEKRTHNTDLVELSCTEKTEIYFADNSDCFVNDDGATEFIIPYTIKSEDTKNSGGIIKLTVTVMDYAGNPTPVKEFILVREVGFSDFTIYNYNFDGLSSYNTSLEQNPLENNKMLKITTGYYDKITPVYEHIYGDSHLDNLFIVQGSYMNITGEYVNRNGQTVKHDFSLSGDEYCLNLDVDTVEGLYVKVTVTNDVGLSVVRDVQFPSGKKLYCAEETEDSYELYIPGIEERYNHYYTNYIALYNDSDCKFITSSTGKVSLEKNIEYEMIPFMCGWCEYSTFDGNLFIVGESSSFTYNQVTAASLELTDVTYQKGQSAGTIDVTLTINEDAWEHFDRIYVPYKDSYDYQLISDFAKGSVTQKIQLPTKKMYNGDTEIIAYGLQDGKLVQSSSVVIPQFTGSDYDNVPAKLSFERTDYETVKITMTDVGSGPKCASLVCPYGRDEIELCSGEKGFEEVEVPVKLLWDNVYVEQLSSGKKYKFYFRTEDMAGNILTDDYDVSDVPMGFPAMSDKDVALSRDTDNKYTVFPFFGVYRSYLLSVYDEENGVWNEVSEDTTDSNIYSIPDESFVKIQKASAKDDGAPQYRCARAFDNTGDYDYVIPYGSDKSALIVSSDAPVLMHTVASSRPYEEACTWSEDEWEFHQRIVDEKYLPFSENKLAAQRYNIPVENIEAGECYVVITYFADGTAVLSEVMKKQ